MPINIVNFFTGLCLALCAARKMKLTKMLIMATLPYFEKNYESLTLWESKNWCHGAKKGKGKDIAHMELWQEISELLRPVAVEWCFNSKGKTHSTVLKSAQSMALLPYHK